MKIEDLPGLLQQLQDRSAEQAAFKDLFTELQRTLSELLEHQEAALPALAKAVADALKGVRVAAPTIKVEAPNVTVQPPQVHVAAPSVTVTPQITVEGEKRGKGCDIEFQYGAGGVITGAKVRHL